MIRFIIQALVTMAGLWLSAKVVPGVAQSWQSYDNQS